MKTIIVWFRNDLRIHDHPALAAAAQDADAVLPVFILDSALLRSERASSNRNRFLLESLQDLRQSLQTLGADLVLRDGSPATELVKLAQEYNASAVYYSADYTPYALQRDKAVTTALAAAHIESRSFGGRLIVDELDAIRTKTGQPYKVFTPFFKNWQHIGRRALATMPAALRLPPNVHTGTLPAVSNVTKPAQLSPHVVPGGETAGRTRLHDFLTNNIEQYHELHNDLAADGTSRLSPCLHFGCLSPLEIETLLPPGDGPRAWHRQLAWREFYNYILLQFPANTQQEFQERYRTLQWQTNPQLFNAWKAGQTGYPVVDAAMRQLQQEGFMHNRGRLIVGSFLSKDLWLNWREGEAYFMQMLVDGDTANNNGNWQWIASVGVDPAPVFRRLYNPASQRDTYDPTGAYTRRYVPELTNVPDKYLSSPWLMPLEVQQQVGCIIGKDYPAPIVDHAQARAAALDQYRR